MSAVIYRIINIHNRKSYIGITKNLKKRKFGHKNGAFNKNSCTYKTYFAKAIRKNARG